jgi:hypothetical protein
VTTLEWPGATPWPFSLDLRVDLALVLWTHWHGMNAPSTATTWFEVESCG